MVGLLYALPNTGLHRRLAKEGRLYPASEIHASESDADQCTSGLNFETRRPRENMLEDYRSVVRAIYTPGAFFARVSRMARELDLSDHRVNQSFRDLLRDARSFFRITWHSGIRNRGVRGPFWSAVGDCLVRNPRALRTVYSQAALFLHFFPYSRFLDGRLQGKIDALAVERTAGPWRRGDVPLHAVPDPRVGVIPD
jgi:hypothetical protein